MRTLQKNICYETGCTEEGVYLDDKARWRCQKHKPAKLFLFRFDKEVLRVLTINKEKMSIYDISQALSKFYGLDSIDEFKVQESIGRLEINGVVELSGFRDIYREDGGAIALALYKRTNTPILKKSCDEGCSDCEGSEDGKVFSVDITLSECQIRAIRNNDDVIGDGMKGDIINQVFLSVRKQSK